MQDPLQKRANVRGEHLLGLAAQPRRSHLRRDGRRGGGGGVFKEFPPRSFPPSFVPTTVMEQTIDELKNRGAIGRALR